MPCCVPLASSSPFPPSTGPALLLTHQAGIHPFALVPPQFSLFSLGNSYFTLFGSSDDRAEGNEGPSPFSPLSSRPVPLHLCLLNFPLRWALPHQFLMIFFYAPSSSCPATSPPSFPFPFRSPFPSSPLLLPLIPPFLSLLSSLFSSESCNRERGAPSTTSLLLQMAASPSTASP